MEKLYIYFDNNKYREESMKKIITVLMLVVLCACSGSTSNGFVDELDKSKVSSKEWGYEVSYNSIQNPMSMTVATIPTKEGLLLKNTIDDYQGMSNGFLLESVNLKSFESRILNSDVTSSCSKSNYKECSGYLEGDILYVNYYNDNLYYTTHEIDPDTDKWLMNMYQMKKDGSDRKKVLSVAAGKGDQNTIFTPIFHKGYLYYSNVNQIVKVNIDNWEQKLIFEQERVRFTNLQFSGDTLYINVLNYTDENDKVVPQGVMELDLKTEKHSIIYTSGVDVLHTTDDYHIVMEMDGTYFKSRNSEELKKISESWGFIFTNSEYILISEEIYDSEGALFILVDSNGNVLDTLEKNKDYQFGSLLTDDAFYVVNKKSKTIDRIRIDNGKFMDIETVFNYN